MGQISYRKAKKRDIEEIVGLNGNLFKEDGGTRDKYINVSWPQEEGESHFRKFFARKTYTIFVAEGKGEIIIAYLAGYTKPVESWRPVKRSEIESMYVVGEYRESGIGSKLVEMFFKWSKNKGIKLVKVTAYSKNKKAISFYQKHRFNLLNTSLEVVI